MDVFVYDKEGADIAAGVVRRARCAPCARTMDELYKGIGRGWLDVYGDVLSTDDMGRIVFFAKKALKNGIDNFLSVFRRLFTEESADNMSFVIEEWRTSFDDGGWGTREELTGFRWVADDDFERVKEKVLRRFPKRSGETIARYETWRRYRDRCRTLSIEDRLGMDRKETCSVSISGKVLDMTWHIEGLPEE